MSDSLMFRELKHGIPVTDENDNRLGESSNAAQQAITQVVVSRILMASPGMGLFLVLVYKCVLDYSILIDLHCAVYNVFCPQKQSNGQIVYRML